MSVTTHIIEVIRHGIWASITGGWYYEPGCSVFCNTVHVYVWLILMVIPLTLGVFLSGGITISAAVAYSGFIVFLFTFIKIIISYFHMIFDTTDPIVVTRTITDSTDEIFAESEPPPLDFEMVELRDMGFNVRGSQRTMDYERRDTAGRSDRDSTGGLSNRHNFGNMTDRSSLCTRYYTGPVHNSSRRVRIDDQASQPMPLVSGCSLNSCEDQELGKEINIANNNSNSFFEQGNKSFEMTNDTPEVNKFERVDASRTKSSSRTESTPTFKTDEAIASAKLSSNRKRRRNSDPYSLHVLQNSDEIELLKRKIINDSANRYGSNADDCENCLVSASEAETPMTNLADHSRKSKHARRRSSTGATSSRKRHRKRSDSPAVFLGELIKKESHESSKSMPSSVGWTPVIVSLGDKDTIPTTSRYSADDAEISGDIKGEITKFLEDLIDKHPETMDAIENVRANRLGRVRPHSELSQESVLFEQVSSSTRQEEGPNMLSSEVVPHSLFSIPPLFRNPNRRSNSFIDWHPREQSPSTSQQHIAHVHEDTTQGAVHTFKDEDGMWWTYTFNENGVGTAQPLGSGRAVLDLIERERDRSREREKTQETSRKGLFPGELEVLPESLYDSTEDETEEFLRESVGVSGPRSEQSIEVENHELYENDAIDITTCVQNSINENIKTSESHGHDVGAASGIYNHNQRVRALSSSSNESSTYIPTLPSSVFHAPSGTGLARVPASTHGNQVVCLSDPQSRIRNTLRESDERSADSMWQMEQIMELIENTNGLRREQPGIFSQSERQVVNRRPSSNIRKSYYYQMKIFPKVQKSFNLKLDRPSVDRLFDRNRCIVSLIFDVLLAACISLITILVIDADIFYDVSLFFFCVGVAGAHFSLLKSVQPDASSPIHGFNWIVAYNRPLYFCIISLLLLYLHQVAGGKAVAEETVSWNWNPFRLHMTSLPAVILASRDIISTTLLLLPVAFTFGWLPQVNTLLHHVFEQIEMHCFGGTASFGVYSALIQLVKSIAVYVPLCLLCRVAYDFSPIATQTPVFSTFSACAVSLSYLLSRQSSNTSLMVLFVKALTSPFRNRCSRETEPSTIDMVNIPISSSNTNENGTDKMIESVRKTILERARYDLIFFFILLLVYFALHSTSIFTATQPYFMRVIAITCFVIGLINHYLYPRFRSHTPWKYMSQPILKSAEHGQFECPEAAKLMYFEVIHLWMVAIERNIIYPLLVVSLITENCWNLPYSWILIPVISMRLLRGGFSHPQLMYLPIGLAFIASTFDFKELIQIPHNGKILTSWNLLPLIIYVFVCFFPKVIELYLKISFIMAYVAPWQISWGSAFHAFAQPFSVPHSALIAVQTIISSIVSAPLNPFLGSSFFTSSYVRPVKFWERDYNTKRSDASNMRLASQIDRGPTIDDSNLNGVFYEHLTRSLQKSLAGDLAMGRWSTSVQPGDCFILASYYLNCLVHIIEVGNGFVTFQLRGLEFRGTYCHQREVEAITDDIRDGTGCCCCAIGALPGFLSLNTAWGLRWLAWEVVSGKYIIDGYSISDNSAVNLLQVHELRRLLVTLYVKCIIHYTLSSEKLSQWLEDEVIKAGILKIISTEDYVDVDTLFCATNDEDYDTEKNGISFLTFSSYYASWLDYCIELRKAERPDKQLCAKQMQTLCFMLSLLARRSLGTAAFNRHSGAAESFLYGLHSLFKGDFRITSSRDEWVFSDMDMLRFVVAPAVKMALKLHQDHFAHFEEFDDSDGLHNIIKQHQQEMFISHEQDPGWRTAILENTQSLLALRHVYDDGQDDYKIIMLNKMNLNMRVIKLNRECVRAFWAGQQQELIFLRNRNPERGSIQNARQVLRNMINSSADQPVGYPIYVSPLTTSLIESHPQIEKIFGPTFTFEAVCNFGSSFLDRLRNHFGPSGSTSINQQQSQQSTQPSAVTFVASLPTTSTMPATRPVFHVGPPTPVSVPEECSDSEEDREVSAINSLKPVLENSIVEMTKDGVARVSIIHNADTTSLSPFHNNNPQTERERMIMSRPSLERHLKSGALINDNEDLGVGAWVVIVDPEYIFKCLNEPMKQTGECMVHWPDELMQHMGGKSSWLYLPVRGMVGRIAYTWYPNHPLKSKRSHVGDHIHLLAIQSMPNGLIPVAEKGIRLLSVDECAIPGISGHTPQERSEFLIRYIDVLVLAKIVSGTVSHRTSFPKKPPIPPPSQTPAQPLSDAGSSTTTVIVPPPVPPHQNLTLAEQISPTLNNVLNNHSAIDATNS